MALTKNQVEHREYLQTPQWKALRARALDRDNHICQRCKKKRACQVHHLTYERWKNENLEDLQSLCAGCHIKVHKLDKINRKVKGKNKNRTKHVKQHQSIYNPNTSFPKLEKRMKEIHKLIKIINEAPGQKFVLSRKMRKLLLPHPVEMLDHFGIQGRTYSERMENLKIWEFDKGDLIAKLLTIQIPFKMYLDRKRAEEKS